MIKFLLRNSLFGINCGEIEEAQRFKSQMKADDADYADDCMIIYLIKTNTSA